MRRLPRWLRGLLGVAVVGVVLGSLVLGILYRKHVILEPGDHIARVAIESVIAQESPVYYADGRTRLGGFFSREHREHVPYGEIPEAWVQAITASEDKRFWEHFGVDVWGITRAMIKNILSGRVVAGGSTLTQQPAKNLETALNFFLSITTFANKHVHAMIKKGLQSFAQVHDPRRIISSQHV